MGVLACTAASYNQTHKKPGASVHVLLDLAKMNREAK